MSKETAVSMETLNVVQQVLKGALLAIAAASRCDPAEVATFLQGFAQRSPPLDSRAVAMLSDLAAGFEALSDGPRY
jgi:hypothetical protein